jgi:very-long-chain (3R)-3-hydroxyacyl-CoA dehydratase
MKISDCYLVLYNLLSCLGWAHLLFITFSSFTQLNRSPTSLWKAIGSQPFSVGPVSFGGYGALHVIQSAAFLEVVHVAIGLVPSSLFANLMQVFVRIILA